MRLQKTNKHEIAKKMNHKTIRTICSIALGFFRECCYDLRGIPGSFHSLPLKDGSRHNKRESTHGQARDNTQSHATLR